MLIKNIKKGVKRSREKNLIQNRSELWAILSVGLLFVASVFMNDTRAADLDNKAVKNGNTFRSGSALPTIIISPEWRPINAQSVAKSVSQFSGEQLDATGTQNTIDLQYDTPGFVFKTNSVLGQPYLRGVGSDIITAGAEASVATFIDGIYQPRAFDSIIDFYDIDRVEVIRGPQAVSLGRNVFGGAVSIHSRDPVFYRSAWADVLYGDYDKRQFRGAINIPVPAAHMALRLAGSTARRDGYSYNRFLDEDADNENYQAMRGKLLYRPGSNFSMLLTADYREEASNRAIAPWPDPNNGVNGGIEAGGIVPDDPRKLTSNVRPDLNIESARYSVRANWKMDQRELVSTTALLETDVTIALDLDGTNADFAGNFPSADSTAFMQEFRLFSTTKDRFNWTLGAFFLQEDARQTLDVRLPQAGIVSHPDGKVDTLSWALFGQVDYQFDSHWRARAGVRHSRDRRKLDLVKTVSSPSGVSTTAQNEQEAWQATTPELVLEYTPQDDRLYYVSVSRGYKAGGYNTSSIQPAFDPEYLWAWEFGVKSRLLDQRLQFNAAFFYYDYQDMQLRTPPEDASNGTFPRVINAAKSIIRGIDIETRYRPTWNFGLSLNATLMDARFENFVSMDPNNPAENPDRSGDPLPQAPELSVNVGSDYTWPVDYGTITFRAGYRYQSAVYFNIYKDNDVKEKGYGIVNASLEFESRKGRWYGELYGRNLTDELYAQSIIRNDPLIGIKYFWGAPRTVGLRLGYRL